MPGVAYPGVRDNRSTINTKTGYDMMMTVIGTLAIDGWPGWAAAPPSPSSLYQMLQPTHQRPVYQLRIVRCGTIIASTH